MGREARLNWVDALSSTLSEPVNATVGPFDLARRGARDLSRPAGQLPGFVIVTVIGVGQMPVRVRQLAMVVTVSVRAGDRWVVVVVVVPIVVAVGMLVSFVGVKVVVVV